MVEWLGLEYQKQEQVYKMPEISYEKIVIEALKKDAFSRRSLPMIGTIILAAIFIFTLLADFIFKLPSNLVPFAIWGFLFFFLKIFLVLLIFWIITLFFGGIVIKQAGEDAKGEQICLKEGFSFVKNKMLSLICAGILIAFIPSVIDLGVSNIPYVGGLLSFVVSIIIALLVFVTYPCIVLGERGAIDAISASIHHFIGNKLQIFIIWLLRSVIGLAITFIFAIPFIIVFILLIFPWLPLQGFPPYFPSMMPIIVIASITIVILAIGLSIALVFSYGVTARYYNTAIGRTDEDDNEGDVE